MGRIPQFDCPFCEKFFTDKPHLKFHVQEEHSSGITAANSGPATVTRATATGGKMTKEEKKAAIEALLPQMEQSIKSRSEGDIIAVAAWTLSTIKAQAARNNKPYKLCDCDDKLKDTCHHDWQPASRGINASATHFNELFVEAWSSLLQDMDTVHQVAYIRAFMSVLQDRQLVAVVPKASSGKRPGSVWYYKYSEKPQSYNLISKSEKSDLLTEIAEGAKAILAELMAAKS